MKYLYAIDTVEFPGKVRLRYVEFSEELAETGPEFEARNFDLCDPQRPEIRQFINTMMGKAKKVKRWPKR